MIIIFCLLALNVVEVDDPPPGLWDSVFALADTFPIPEPANAYALKEVVIENGENWELKAVDVRTIIAAQVDTVHNIIIWIVRGEGNVMVADRKWEVKSGDLFKIPRNRTFAYTNKSPEGTRLVELLVIP